MTTTPNDLNTTDWADCGTTPCFVQVLGESPVRFVVGDTKPTDKATPGHVLERQYGGGFADVGVEGQKLFAIALGRKNTLMVTR